jgi:ribosomal protein S18 acetylase RimI-like enzyme
VAGIAYRQAGLDDAAEIHALLLALAAEIPLLVATLEREEALYTLTRNCARSGESWVAVDVSGRIVGFLLVELAQARRHYAEHEVLELRYGGVAATHRQQGIFTALVDRVFDRRLPVTASVSPANQSGAASLLEKLGFHNIGSPGGEQRLRWDPGAAAGDREQ